MNDAAAVRAAALAAAGRGDDAGATRLFAQAVAAYPRDAALLNSAGNFHAGAGRPPEALALFEAALAADPMFGEAAINRAIVLGRLDRQAEALADLLAREATLTKVPRYWTTRAAAETACGRLDAAAASYAQQLRRDPGHVRALHGRARTALDRGEVDAVAHYDRALARTPGDPWLLHGLAQALDAEGDRTAALDIAGQLATHLPQWIDALELYATLRWAAGDRADFCDHYRTAAAQHPDAACALSWAAMLSGVDRHGEAAEVLAQGRNRIGDHAGLLLAEAIQRGEAGQDAEAAALLAQPYDDPDWQIARGRQALRTGAADLADRRLGEAIVARPDDVTAWSLRDLAWRVMGDPRHQWLHGDPALVRELSLGLDDDLLVSAIATLDALHDRAAMPIGQSVKLGSQTRGGLFQRSEPVLRRLAETVAAAVECYRADLPPADPSHPLLGVREAPWRIVGSWSIRLNGAGRHAAHVHPHGLLSSAAYFAVPDEDPGLLELGRPPTSLRLDLPPLRMVTPRVGTCVLFPSTMFHGTRPIVTGRRMTIAFDVGRE